MKETAKLTNDFQMSDGRDDALVVVSFTHELASVVRENFTQCQNGSSIFQVINTEILGRLNLFAVQIPENRRPWITLHFHFKSVNIN